MVKLQKTIRGNGSIVYSMNIPLDIIDQIGWEKGDELEMIKNFDRLIITKKIKEVPEVEPEIKEIEEVSVPEKQVQNGPD